MYTSCTHSEPQDGWAGRGKGARLSWWGLPWARGLRAAGPRQTISEAAIIDHFEREVVLHDRMPELVPSRHYWDYSVTTLLASPDLDPVVQGLND